MGKSKSNIFRTINLVVLIISLVSFQITASAKKLSEVNIIQYSEDEYLKLLQDLSQGNFSAERYYDFNSSDEPSFYSNADNMGFMTCVNGVHIGSYGVKYNTFDREIASELIGLPIWTDEDGVEWYVDRDPNEQFGQIIIAPVKGSYDEILDSDLKYHIVKFSYDSAKTIAANKAAKEIAAHINTGDVDSTIQNLVNYFDCDIKQENPNAHKLGRYNDYENTYGVLVEKKVLSNSARYFSVALVAAYCGIPAIYMAESDTALVYRNGEGEYVGADVFSETIGMPITWSTTDTSGNPVDYKKCLDMRCRLLEKYSSVYTTPANPDIRIAGEKERLIKKAQAEEEAFWNFGTTKTSENPEANQQTSVQSNDSTASDSTQIATTENKLNEKKAASSEKIVLTGGFSLEQISKGFKVTYDSVKRPTYKVVVKGVDNPYYGVKTTTANILEYTGLVPGCKYNVSVGINTNFEGTVYSEPVTIEISQ